MTLSCSCGDPGDYDWHYQLPYPLDFMKLDKKRARRCCSCRERIGVGDGCVIVYRYRAPRYDIEERIYGEEVPLAPWWLCESCGGLMMAIDSLDLCCTLSGESLKQQIADFNLAMGVQTIKKHGIR